MRFTILLFVTALFGALVGTAPAAQAQLTPWSDYDVSDAVWSITTVKVHPNMGDDYLEGIKKSWVPSVETSMKLGFIEEYSIFRSDLPQSGDFNLLLVVKFKNTADLAPSKEKYDAFMKAWGKEREAESRETSKNYPSMREITGEYQVREITMK